MNVQELIELLQQQDPTSEVVVRDFETTDCFDPEVSIQLNYLVEYTEKFKEDVNRNYLPYITWEKIGYEDRIDKIWFKATRLNESRVLIAPV